MSLTSRTRLDGTPAGPTVQRLIAWGSGCPAACAARIHSAIIGIGLSGRSFSRNSAAGRSAKTGIDLSCPRIASFTCQDSTRGKPVARRALFHRFHPFHRSPCPCLGAAVPDRIVERRDFRSDDASLRAEGSRTGAQTRPSALPPPGVHHRRGGRNARKRS